MSPEDFGKNIKDPAKSLEDFRRNIKEPPVQQELFTKQEADKKYDALTAKMKEYVEKHRKKLVDGERKVNQLVVDKKEITTIEKSCKSIWSIGMPISGENDRYNEKIDDDISLGDDGIWRVNGKENISEERVISYIMHYFVEKKAQELIDDMEKCKKENNI